MDIVHLIQLFRILKVLKFLKLKSRSKTENSRCPGTRSVRGKDSEPKQENNFLYDRDGTTCIVQQ